MSARRQWLRRWAGTLLLAAALPTHAAPPLQWRDVKSRIREKYPDVPQMSVATLHRWLNDARRPPPLLIDTRTAEEFADGHIEGAIRIDTAAAALRRVRQRPAGTLVVLYCSVGYRSSALADDLLADGVTGLYNLEGSLFEWANADYAVLADDGRRGKVHPYNRKWGVLLRRDLWSREP